MLSLAVISGLKAHQIFLLERLNREAPFCIQRLNKGRIFDYQQKLGRTAREQIRCQALLVMQGKFIAGVGAEVAIIRRIKKKKIVLLRWIIIQKYFKIQVGNDGSPQMGE